MKFFKKLTDEHEDKIIKYFEDFPEMKIQAIRAYQIYTNVALRESKDTIDRVYNNYQLSKLNERQQWKQSM